MKKLIIKYTIHKLIQISLFALLLLLPFASFSQPPNSPTPPIPGSETPTAGGNPDPAAVPIDGVGYLLIAGLAFAAVVTVKQWRASKVIS